MHIKLNLKPLSLNNAYRNNRQGIRFKTQKYREWESVFKKEIKPYLNELEGLFKAFDPKRHGFYCTYDIYCPIETKDGRISKTSGDVSNMPKLLEDLLFSFGVDDCNVLSVKSRKHHSEEIFTLIQIELVER